MAGDSVEIDPFGLTASVAQTSAAAAAAGVNTGAAVTALGGGGDALTAEIAATIATWPAQNASIGADIAAGGTHLAQCTAATTTGLTATDDDSGAHIDTITT